MTSDGTVTLDVRCGTCGAQMRLEGYKAIGGVMLASYACLRGHGAADVSVKIESPDCDYRFDETKVIRR